MTSGDELRKLAEKNLTVNEFMEYLASRQRHASEMTVEKAMKAIPGATRAEVIQMFKSLETLGIGDWLLGRHGKKTRFEWKAYPGDVAKAWAGEIDGIPLEAKGTDFEDQEEEPDFVEHKLQLRRNIEISLSLPVDLSDKEASKIARWIENLAFIDE